MTTFDGRIGQASSDHHPLGWLICRSGGRIDRKGSLRLLNDGPRCLSTLKRQEGGASCLGRDYVGLDMSIGMTINLRLVFSSLWLGM